MAKVEPRKITTAPNVSSPSGEQNFVDKHFPGSVPQSGDYKQYSPNDDFLEPDNGIFDVGKGKDAEEKVKIFDRMKNHFGYDQEQSIKKYDESVTINDRVKNAHKVAKVRHFFDRKGNWKGSSTAYKTNADAKKENKGVVVVKESYKAIKARIKLNEDLLNECGSREWAMKQIMFPNSSGQGYSESHKQHPLHGVIVGNNFKYSHSTPIGKLGEENTFYIHHTYKNSEHSVGVDGHRPDNWESKTSTASGSRVTGKGADSLNKHMAYKVKKYKLEPEVVNESVARSTQKAFADSKGKMKQSDEIDKKDSGNDKVKGFIQKLRKKKD